jgi:uncharacterized membrane protein YjjP (DUF1212 family)
VQSYTNRYSRPLLRIGIALLILAVLNLVFTGRSDTLLVAFMPLLTGLVLRLFPVVRIGVDQIEVRRGFLKPKVVVLFSAIRGIDETHSKFVRVSTTGGDVRIPTGVLGKGERVSLLDDLRMGTKQSRTGAVV